MNRKIAKVHIKSKGLSMIKSKKQMITVIAVFALLLLVGGTTYAFFNYTRTGPGNTIGTGRIFPMIAMM